MGYMGVIQRQIFMFDSEQILNSEGCILTEA